MHFLVLGGSGRVGKLVIQEALSRGHQVTALVRDEASLYLFSSNKNLTTIKGSLLGAADIGKAFTLGPEPPKAVILTLNNGPTTPTLMHDSHVNVIESIKKHGPSTKVVTLQALGVGESWPNLFWMIRMFVKKSNVGITYKDHEAVETVVKDSGINYVLARPTRLAEGEAKAVRFFGDDGKGIGSFDSISLFSVASFLVDAAEKSDWDRQTPVLAN